MQSKSLDDPGDGNDDTMLHELENNSRQSSINILNGSANAIRTSPRITQEIDTSNRYNDGIIKNDKLLVEKLAGLLPSDKSLGKTPEKGRVNETDLSLRRYSDINILGKSSNTGNDNGKGTTQRSRSEGNVQNIGDPDNKSPNFDRTARVPEKKNKVLNGVSSFLNENDLDTNDNLQKGWLYLLILKN